MLRRLLAISLTVVLLAPWIAALSGAAVSVVPCPMHRSGATSHDHAGAMVAGHDNGIEHHSPAKHGTSARGCNCVGECGRSGALFSLPAKVPFRGSLSGVAEATPACQQSDFGSAARLLHRATGPPQRLQI